MAHVENDPGPAPAVVATQAKQKRPGPIDLAREGVACGAVASALRAPRRREGGLVSLHFHRVAIGFHASKPFTRRARKCESRAGVADARGDLPVAAPEQDRT